MSTARAPLAPSAEARAIADRDLPVLVVRCLSDGRPQEALAYAERACRMAAVPDPDVLMLRARAYAALDLPEPALSDAANALGIDPNHSEAAALILALAPDEGSRRAAADIVLGSSPRASDLKAALAVLKADGTPGHASLRFTAAGLEGRVVWEAGTEAVVVTEGEDEAAHLPIASAANHPLQGPFAQAADLFLCLPPTVHAARLEVDGTLLAQARRTARRALPSALPSPLPATGDEAPAGVTVLIPVYDDFEATVRCVESVLAHRLPGTRLVLVDDCTPDPAIAAFLDALDAPDTLVLRNPSNLGFVGAVNLGLEAIGGGDVILLNADTVVPAGFVERLAAVAYGAPDIGTVVPMSNNGEFVSLPRPFIANPLPDPDRLAIIDALAARVNAGKVRDLPSGIGFCLYITRRCLADVPRLSEGWGRGYLEDADFCLRARARGWRNVCAGDIFVGHEGTRSFKGDKRSLVMRNLPRLAERFPTYRLGCAAFVHADPLADLRAAIARGLPADGVARRLVVAGPRLSSLLGQLPSRTLPTLHLEVQGTPAAATARLTAPEGDGPWRLPFTLGADDGALLNQLRACGVAEIEVLAHEPLPLSLWAVLCALERPIDVRIVDLRTLPSAADGQAHGHGLWPAGCEAHLGVVQAANDAVEARLRAQPFAPFDYLSPPIRRLRMAGDVPAAAAGRAIGILSPVASAAGLALTEALAARRVPAGMEDAIFVLGPSLSEARLISRPFVFPLGPVSPQDLTGLIAQHKIGALVVPDPHALGHPLVEAAADLPVPVAWPLKETLYPGSDLALALGAAASESACLIDGWIESKRIR
ncbi:glycosyltransferase family 2 protein [Aquabacter sp. L1I39]|uniref:glycosyltransferase family 2 protein n=1 Tax=Aquabacter sp. L1I39 TaxID=2820278 RepID=UPI001ADCD486|nr:glycosyltransferase family 2 protein [Aquabacter sp. L1I39]QTL04839.1 glycosyltransferase family 2 protein [Aquabacter sp. L1I39]